MKKLILTLTVIFSVATISIACDGDAKKEGKKCCSKGAKKACASGETAKACAAKSEGSCKKAAKGACCKSKAAHAEATVAPEAPAQK